MRPILILLCALAGSSLLQAQDTGIRETRIGNLYHRIRNAAGQTIESGFVKVPPNASLTAATLVWFDDADVTKITKNMPFTRFGSMQRLADRDYLVSGYTVDAQGNPLKGHILVVRLVPGTPRTISILTSKEYSIFDAYSVRWNLVEGRLYILDSKNKKLWFAPWSGGGSPPSLPAAQGFTVAMDSQSCSSLKNPVLWKAYCPSGKPGIVLTIGGSIASGTWVYQSPFGWKSQLYIPPPGGASWGIRNGTRVPTLGQMTITGAGSYEIRDAAGSLVASGQAASRQWMDISCPAVFNDRPGVQYTLSGGELSPRKFRPTVRYGTPTTNALFELSHGIFRPSQCAVGAINFGIGYGLKLSQELSQPEIWNVSLWVGVRDAVTGHDPVTIVGDTAVLQPIAVYDSVLKLPADMSSLFPAIKFPIPADGSLENSVLLWQVIVAGPNQEIAASDVFGSTVFPMGGDNPQQASKNTTKKPPIVDLRKLLGLKGKALSLHQAKAVKNRTEFLVKYGFRKKGKKQ